MQWPSYDAAGWDRLVKGADSDVIDRCPPLLAFDRDEGAVALLPIPDIAADPEDYGSFVVESTVVGSAGMHPVGPALRRIAERSKRLVWLNPEGRMAWGWGDSEMPRYSTFCTVVRQCATAKQLERAVSDIVASYQ